MHSEKYLKELTRLHSRKGLGVAKNIPQEYLATAKFNSNKYDETKMIEIMPSLSMIIIADYLATHGAIPGVATNYAWADDMAKIVFNTFTSMGFFGGVPGPLQVFDVNAGSSFTIPSSTWDYPIFWRQSNTANIKNSISPNNFSIFQNYPNPFNPITSLRYDLPEDGLVNITIYDMMGRIVKTLVNGSQTAGFKSVQWNATNDRNEPVSAGLYLYTIQAGEFRQTRKMVLLK